MWTIVELATIRIFLDQVATPSMLDEMITTLDDLGLVDGNLVVPMLSAMLTTLRAG